ncbi:hypothetical protein BpHYR1_050636 [Brachionus plicatilis]|uniref:Uncharacterized protein n=1 Tax=Brachionus plicatilis TaxID=10195 RepID=A0A3M7PKN9_BRAPC|nr:hypothetical protein BpHYR1_050636 [Brachionus plicatilis]
MHVVYENLTVNRNKNILGHIKPMLNFIFIFFLSVRNSCGLKYRKWELENSKRLKENISNFTPRNLISYSICESLILLLNFEIIIS